MPDIFISYRRGDTAGHAGRLFDCIRERFGDESVFMDITDIEPGDDFVRTLDSALSSSRIVLVVIGPDWLTCTGTDGRRRLDDPGDHLRLEVAHALRSNARVIPVLVRGARMPIEGDLPDDLEALARRQAQEVSDSRWSYDSDQLIRIIENTVGKSARSDQPSAISVPAPRSGAMRLVAPATILAMLLALLTLYLRLFGGTGPVQTGTSGSTGASTGSTTTEGGREGRSRSDRPEAAARLPPSGEVRAGPTMFKILGGLVNRSSDGPHDVRFYVRIHNVAARYGYNVSHDSFRLLVNDRAIAPEEAPIEAIAMQSASDAWVSFRVPANADAVQLQVGELNRATAKIPIDLRTAGAAVHDVPALTWKSPVDIPLAIEKRIGGLVFNIDGARLEHVGDAVPPLQPEKLELKFKVRIKNVGLTGGYPVGGDEFRLIVDDVPQQPTTFPILALEYQTDSSSEIVFNIPGTATKTILQIGDLNADHVQVPVDLSLARLTS